MLSSPANRESLAMRIRASFVGASLFAAAASASGKRIRLRFGAVSQKGSVAVIERFICPLRDYCTRRIIVPLRRRDVRKGLTCHLDWYNEHRPHEYLDGRTPNGVYHDRPAASEAPRIERRSCMPPTASCADRRLVS